MKMNVKRILKKTAVALGSAVVVFFVLDRLAPVHTEIGFARVVEARDGVILNASLAKDQQWRMFTRLDEITPELKKAIVFKEDKYFYHHTGINPMAIGRAVFHNVFRMRRTSGASTITMQVARMLEPKPRTYLNKCIEMFRATQLEVHYSKDQILQMYLNMVPYGSNIQGVKAASLLYFNKTPDQLSLAEITALSIIPNRPNSMVMGKDNIRIMTERNKWLLRFKEEHLFPDNVISDAMNEPLNAVRHAAPSGVPQFAVRIKKEHPLQPEIKSTLDRHIQQNAENIVAEYMNQLKLHNINNAAVLIVDNQTHEVLTYIGSSDFKDKFHFGQVDGVRAVRSPGSTLKPLLYGISFDAGRVTPKSIIEDVPLNINGYMPENYDRTFRGNVSTEFALRNSLNIPAVKLLDEEGVDNFINRMNAAGVTSIDRKKKKPGLSVILGGCSIRLDELTALYTSFANEGKYYPISYTLPDKTGKGKRGATSGVTVLSPSADFMLTHILCELHRPDLPNACDQAMGIPRIAWKTGTSYGRKDAWSIGYNKRYTIGVWLGNFSGAGVPELSGANTATPLLFRLFNTIDYNAANEWLEPPKDLSFRLVCSETGKLPGESCPNQVMDYYIPGVSKNEQCDKYKEVWLSADNKYCYCTSCLPPTGYKIRMVENVSPELAAFYDIHQVKYEHLPPHYPGCSRTFEGQPPTITSLNNGTTYLIADKDEQKLQLSCHTGTDVRKVYWYINDKFYAATNANEHIYFAATTPDIKISCTDDKGRCTSIAVKVKFI